MVIKYRLVRMMLRKAWNIPKGQDFFRYTSNRVNCFIQKKQLNPIIKHPTSLMIELTNHCQLKCIICAREYILGKQMNVGHMDFTQFKKLIDENHIYLDRIGLTGLGETLLYPKIIDAINYIGSKNKGILIFLSTNAYQANTPTLVEEMANKIDTLQISLDGIGSTFEGIRKKSKFDRYYSNLEKISRFNHKARMNIKFNMVVFKDNYREMKKVVELAKELRIKEIYFNTFNLVANYLDLTEYNFYQTSEFRDEFNKALVKARQYGIYVGYRDLDAPKGFRFCGYPWNDFYITWDGFAVPCCAKPFPKVLNFGNVFSEGLMPVLNCKNYQEFRKLSKENKTPDFCRRCHKIHSRNNLVQSQHNDSQLTL